MGTRLLSKFQPFTLLLALLASPLQGGGLRGVLPWSDLLADRPTTRRRVALIRKKIDTNQFLHIVMATQDRVRKGADR